MPHTYVSDLVHCVFSTKERRKLIRTETQSDLWAFIGGMARKNGFKALIVGGTEDHVHVLLSLPAVMPLAKAVQLLIRIVVAMNERNPHERFRLAGGIRRVHGWSFTEASHGRLHQKAGRTSSEGEFGGRICSIFEKARD
jgi:REP element-mobilizing transposase RayT